jgi:putative addiction module killer protein
MYEIRHYLTSDDKDIFISWFKKIKDIKAQVAISRRINRLELGNFGDNQYCRNSIWELRIDVGAGYRVYYVMNDKKIILLLCGGNKKTQDKDIELACKYWEDWQNRTD